MHCWHIVGQPSVDFLTAIQPYLLLKAPQAKLAIEAWETREPIPRQLRYLGVPTELRRKRGKHAAQMTQLNRKGA